MDTQDAFIVLGQDEDDSHSNLEGAESNSLWEVGLLVSIIFGILIFLSYRKWKAVQIRKRTLEMFNSPYSGKT